MFKPDNSKFKTPLSYYEKAIEELRRSREELQELKAVYLQNMDSNFQDLCSEIKELKRELQITKDTVKNSEKQASETQTRLKEISQLVEKLFIASTVNAMDYGKLENLLKEQKWQEADQETYSVILKICGHQKGRWLVDQEIQKLSAQDLRNINDLWVKYSQGKFGFSIQKGILQASNGCQEFAHEVGWLINSNKKIWVKHDGYKFSLDAPKGHLPSIPRLVGLGYRNVSEKSFRINRINLFLSHC